MSSSPDVDAAASAAGNDHHIAHGASLQERRLSVLKHGDTFAVFDPRGDFDGAPGSPEGLYHRDTRVLSACALLIDGRRPLLLSSATRPDNAVFTAEMTNPDLERADGTGLRRESIHLHRMKFVHRGACMERLLVRNYSEHAQHFYLAVRFAADFADLFEVRGERRARRGAASAEVAAPDRAALRYVALDGIAQCTHVAFHPAPDRLEAWQAVFDLTLAPGEERRLFLRIAAADDGIAEWSGTAFLRSLRHARAALRAARAREARVETSSTAFRDVLRRSTADLHMLITDTPAGPYPYAGTPWFSTPFGRDGIITALMTLWLDPSIARGVLRFLAATQAHDVDPARDAQPGRILHEMRHGEMARLREVPFGRYYGSVDATPLFVMLLDAYVRRTGDLALAHELWPNVDAALAWLDGPGDPDRDGLVEYARASATGLANQGWKDSQDAVFHADGTSARTPVALCEVQGYAYAARVAAAGLAARLGDPDRGRRLHERASGLRERIDAAYWCEDLGTYALALDADKRPCRVATSNAGHLLLCGVPDAVRARRVAATLLDTESFSGWGIRTVAAGASRYNPMSYHNGSVWPHDNALIAMGFARYGLKIEVLAVLEAMFDTALHMNVLRLPELFCGFARRGRAAPTLYPVACAPQAWASASIPALLQAALGLDIDGAANEVRFSQPVLPAFLDELQLRRLRVPGGSVDVMIHREPGGGAAVRTTRCEGAARVVVAA